MPHADTPLHSQRQLHSILVASLLVALFAFTSAGFSEEETTKESIDLAQLDAQVLDSDREHWSFQPVRRPPLPTVKNTDWAKNPIDHFVLARLEKRGWQPATRAKPRALLRRVYLDLIGLPPTLKEQAEFLRDPSPKALDAVVESLLNRPGYGERWGRHWLDLVRYAETNGYERDAGKPHVWRYRDYVIRAFNDDKPYNRFILEQLAGDELEDADSETVIATGYYRLGPWDDEPADPLIDRFDQLDDMVSTTSQVFLGLTLGCCRCHDHKFDALTQHDYYRMVSIVNPLTRPRNGRQELDVPAGSHRQRAALAQRDEKIHQQRQRIAKVRNEFRTAFLKSGRSNLPAEAVAAFLTEAGERSDVEKKLVKDHTPALEKEIAANLDEKSKNSITETKREIERLTSATPDLPRGYFMQEKSPQSPPTHLMIRGVATNPGPQVQPGLPTVLVKSQPAFLAPDKNTSRRRLTLARWIADPQNPLTARVMVNRVWQYHFGTGLVSTSSDFGVIGEKPTHGELLDWLADWFVNEADWSLKKLHRQIMSSNTYCMSRRHNPQYAKEDPENKLLWRTSYRRLEVEAIRDSMLVVSGQLNRKMYGPSMYPYVPPDALTGHSDPGKIWKPWNEREASRRTIYATIKRSLVVPMLEVLDLCDTTKTTPRRTVTSIAPQALTLFNGHFMQRQSQYLAQRLIDEVGDDNEPLIRRAYILALCREPTPAETVKLKSFLEEESARLIATAKKTKRPLKAGQAKRKAVQQMCRVILNLNEFVYTD